MAEQGQATEWVIHFSCDYCKISLTVEDSLAGVTGPCPSCGETITAPRPIAPRKVDVRPREVRGQGNSSVEAGRGDVQVSSWSAANRRSDSGRRRRSISPETGVSGAHREREEVAAVVKMLVAGLIVLAIVLGVAYWLNYRFNAA
ncbi:MAG: putative RNA-binding Zn-ribbon protein involved in translation (DUF1610 family) [Paracoccaceae bacterium]|jgi:predicted RNA-binding Zn-ribbon protein involved in translation (DUF1610 family)